MLFLDSGDLVVSERFTVRVASPKLIFNAAHFVIFGPESCEPIHGHDFRVSAAVQGDLSPTGWVIDFLVLERALAQIVHDFDHVLLIPANSPWLQVTNDGTFIELRAGPRSWRFPASDCRLISIPNVTTELLAQHIGVCLQERLRAELGRQMASLKVMTIELSESEGCTASWTCTFSAQD